MCLMRSRNLFEAVVAAVLFSLPTLYAGTLRVHPQNPRYFTDGTGKAIYLGGHQIFVDLQDNSFNKQFIRNNERTLDWNEYLDFLKQYNLNYLRNWVIWSTGSGSMAPVNRAIAYPMPYKRVNGHGKANDGGLKFDLNQFDQTFFERMHQRCKDLQARGMYVSIMLFEVYGFVDGEPCGNPTQTLWDGNLFNKDNNINGIDVDSDGDGRGIEFFYTKDKNILDLQKTYVKKVVDTLNSLDNVIYEIANELYAPQWQYEMIACIKDHEASKPEQHVVMMSPGGRTPGGGRRKHGAWRMMEKNVVLNSKADCIAITGGWDSGRYSRRDPPANSTGKPAVVDMDHVSPGSNDVGYVWSAFTRGYNFNLYDKPFESPDSEGPKWRIVRRNVGKTVELSKKADLANMNPRGDLASTGFCLANPGIEYIVYQSGGSTFTVSGLQADKSYYYQWYDPEQGEVIAVGRRKVSNSAEKFVPANDGIVLYLKLSENID